MFKKIYLVCLHLVIHVCLIFKQHGTVMLLWAIQGISTKIREVLRASGKFSELQGRLLNFGKAQSTSGKFKEVKSSADNTGRDHRTSEKF